MRTMTCERLRGPCTLELHVSTADEVIKAQDRWDFAALADD